MENKKIILLVEDDSFISDIYQTKLAAENFDVLVAENGLDGLKKMEEKIPDLILLDIIMPYMDGMEFLKKIKAKEEWSKIPVILLTNTSDKEKVEKGLSAGADDYLIKSHFTPAEVIEKINVLLG